MGLFSNPSTIMKSLIKWFNIRKFMSKIYFCIPFAQAVYTNGVFNPFLNLVGGLKLCDLHSVDDYIGEFYKTSRTRKLVELSSFLQKFFIHYLLPINMKEQKKMFISVVHTHAAGIDAGSRFHFVAVGQDKDDVR